MPLRKVLVCLSKVGGGEWRPALRVVEFWRPPTVLGGIPAIKRGFGPLIDIVAVHCGFVVLSRQRPRPASVTSARRVGCQRAGARAIPRCVADHTRWVPAYRDVAAPSCCGAADRATDQVMSWP